MKTRKFKDSAGVEWTVFCVTPPESVHSGGECPAGWLCFDSRAERRRLGEIPTDWTALREDQLARLLELAEQTPRRRLDESTAEFTRRQDHVFAYQPPASDGSRFFCTPDNQLWSVKECEVETDAEAHRVLRFVAGETVRELDAFPDDWTRLTTEQLIVLALNAVPVTSPRPSAREQAEERDEDGRAQG